jgi:hypothetical protein
MRVYFIEFNLAGVDGGYGFSCLQQRSRKRYYVAVWGREVFNVSTQTARFVPAASSSCTVTSGRAAANVVLANRGVAGSCGEFGEALRRKLSGKACDLAILEFELPWPLAESSRGKAIEARGFAKSALSYMEGQPLVRPVHARSGGRRGW